MTRIKYNLCSLLLLFLIGTSLYTAAAAEVDERVVPLPIHELEEVLSSWWTQAGFEVQRSEPGQAVIRLRILQDGADCRFDLSPRSAIAARVKTSVANDIGDLPAEVEKWWRYLALYIHGPAAAGSAPSSDIPLPVFSRIESVVCIRVTAEEENDSFSGLIVDPEGLVISTAHGIPEEEEITATLYDGRELKGTLLYQDTTRDLALIQIQGTGFQATSVVDGRNLLGTGEEVFSIGCVGALQENVTSGTIDGPPRRVDDQPLWQVHMEIMPGNSGSPVFDRRGAFTALVKGRYRGTSSVGFLIPLETIIQFLKERTPL